MRFSAKKTPGSNSIWIPLLGLLCSSLAIAGNTAHEQVMPSQSSTVFVAASSEQVIGLPTAERTAFSLHDTPAIWIISENTEVVAVLTDPPEVIASVPVAKEIPVKPKKKHRVIKQHPHHKPAVVQACVPLEGSQEPKVTPSGSKLTDPVSASATIQAKAPIKFEVQPKTKESH